jgi:release factor glutamine methyltransferase
VCAREQKGAGGPGAGGPLGATEPGGGLDWVTAELQRAGCVAAGDEAVELLAAARGDRGVLRELVSRRSAGEPLAWLVGSARFCGWRVSVCPGVYVPRPQTEALAREAIARLPGRGLAVDLCTGSGAVAVALARARPEARVLATEADPVAAACARDNGVDVRVGDMTAPLPGEVQGQVDVVTAVVPYVPTGELRLLPRDVVTFEPRGALDGGADGTDLLQRAVVESAGLLRPGGSLLLELGGREAGLLEPLLAQHGYRDVRLLRDEEGDPRGVACRR